MSQPVDQDNRSLPRVVLLATDRSQSIIGEIVDGQTKTIAYSAYGEQSAQQRVETRLGFNGQLREANIGWYLLGNGYRTYNPKLMRFHSPDSWSPFRGGGLNAYMYCVGDPVNRVDPTGHAPLFPWLPLRLRKFVSRVDGFLFGGAEHTGGKGIANNAGFTQMKPEKTGEGSALVKVGAMVAVRAPTKKTQGRYPGGDFAPQDVGAHSATRSHAVPLVARIAQSTHSSRVPAHSSQVPTSSTPQPFRQRADSFDKERTIWQGEAPKSPVLVTERLLRSEAPVKRNPVVDVAYPIHPIRLPAGPPPLIVVHPPQ